MKIVYMGTPEFAVAALEALIEAGHEIVGVVTMPDKPAGRGRQLRGSAVKEYAVGRGLRVLQPERLKDEGFLEELRGLGADIQVVVAFRMLPEVVWSMPRYGTVNIHASLLPDYRGAAPINWAIINGERRTGVTSFLLKHDIDTGDIIFQESTEIGEDDDAGTVHDRLMEMGARLAVRTVGAIGDGSAVMRRQDDIDPGTLKKAPKIFKEDMRIDWGKRSEEVVNLVRGLSPYPAAWTVMRGDGGVELSVKIFKVRRIEGVELEHGAVKVVEGERLFVGTGDGAVEVMELQLSGKRRMGADAMLRGMRFEGCWRCE